MRRIIGLMILLVMISSCKQKSEDLFKLNELSPWCILDFDTLHRTPEERIDMLKKLGFVQYGYNRGKGDLREMKKEFQLAKENDIKITSVFLWLNAKRDSVGRLSPGNQELLQNLKQVEDKPSIWLSFSHNFFEDLDQEESIKLSLDMIRYIKLRADEIGCELALYNHHGWFGNPYNQLAILKELAQDSLKMVYNFHHAHDYLDEFEEIAEMITPYLSHVNINGMREEGPQILTIGEGDYEIEMIKILLNQGYNGSWGILGHIKSEDVEKVLQRNIRGLTLMNSKFEGWRKQK